MAELSENGCDDEFDEEVEIAPALWEPHHFRVEEATDDYFTVIIWPSLSADPSQVQLTCLIADDHTFDCIEYDMEWTNCMSDSGILVLVWSMSGAWTSSTEFEGAFTYDLRWDYRDTGSNPCIGPCTTSWTFTAELYESSSWPGRRLHPT